MLALCCISSSTDSSGRLLFVLPSRVGLLHSPCGWRCLHCAPGDALVLQELKAQPDAFRSLPQWHGIEKGRPADSAPWPADSFQMPVTSFDYFAKRYLGYSIRFVPPCQATWTNPAPKVSDCSPVHWASYTIHNSRHQCLCTAPHT